MKKQKIIAHNLRASFDQIADDLNGVMSPLQNKMMRELLKHIDELNVHIKNLDEDIDNHMNDEEKKATSAITEIGGIAGASAKAIISVIGTDMSRFQQMHIFHHGQDYVLETMKVRKTILR